MENRSIPSKNFKERNAILTIEVKVSPEMISRDEGLKNVTCMFERIFERRCISFVKLKFCDCYSGKKLISLPLLPSRFLAICLKDKGLFNETLELLDSSIALIEAYSSQVESPFKKQIVLKLLDEYQFIKNSLNCNLALSEPYQMAIGW